MTGEAWLYLLAVLINAVNLFLQVFFTIMYSDLEWWVDTGGLQPFGALANHAPAITSTLSIYAIASTPTLFPKPLSTLS